MAAVITISVDGNSGNSAAQGSMPYDTEYLETPTDPLSGRNGRNARASLPGADGGYLKVSITESANTPGGIRVEIISNGSVHELPPAYEIPANSIVRLSARGGDGELGGIGEVGETGKPGQDGVAATRSQEATDGLQGGAGGNAGCGSSGGDGGDGGSIDVQVRENMLHLLLALEWDTRGGSGGCAGRAGRPGDGGSGGEGGAGLQWKEDVGFEFSCTPECVGVDQANPARRLLITSSQRLSRELAVIQRQEIIQGQLAEVVRAIAAKNPGFSRVQTAPYGVCRCAGGGGNCLSCRRTPIVLNSVQPRGKNGPPGNRGLLAPWTQIVAGNSGRSGLGQIKVLHDNGTETSYSSGYQLELDAFDLQDENQDGIFEPGECIVIARIRVKNTGGMPSPNCPILITIPPSKWVEPFIGGIGKLYISKSIPPGESISIDGEIKAWIKTPESAAKPGTSFSATGSISMIATMPWLDQKLAGFTLTHEFTIQYPLELSGCNVFQSLVPASTNKLAIEVRNKSSKMFGTSSSSRRRVKVTMAFPSDRGTIFAQSSTWNNQEAENINLLHPHTVERSEQFIGISPGAETNRSATIRLLLHLSLPENGGQNCEGEAHTDASLQLIQQSDVNVKIAAGYQFHDDSAVLLVTNPGTSGEEVEAVEALMKRELNLNVDTWNLGFYGGFRYPGEHGDSNSSTVLSSYAGKSIVFLGKNFEYFGMGPRNSLGLCDFTDLAQCSLDSASILFLGYPVAEYRRHLESFVFPVNHRLQDPTTFVKAQTHFNTRKDLLSAIRQERIIGASKFTTYSLNVKISRVHKESAEIADDLRLQMPQERFLVSCIDHPTAIENVKSGTSKWISSQGGMVVVFRGLPHCKAIKIAESHAIERVRVLLEEQAQLPRIHSIGQIQDRPKMRPILDSFDAYMIVASLALTERISVLYRARKMSTGNSVRYSDFAQKSCELSLLEDLCAEVTRMLRGDSLSFSKHDEDHILSLHLPYLAILLRHPNFQAEEAIPGAILKVLRLTLAIAYPTRRLQAMKKAVLNDQRTRVQQFLSKVIDKALCDKGLRGSVSAFHTQAKIEAPHVENTIAQEISTLTKKTQQECDTSRCCSRDTVPLTIHCESTEWDARVARAEGKKREILQDLDKAWEVLGQKTST